MKTFNHYFDAKDLHKMIDEAFEELGISQEQRNNISIFLEPIRLKDWLTYEHSLRVGLLAKNIASFMHFDKKAAFYAGLLHDIGKSLTDPKTLKKTEAYKSADFAEIRHHVKDGYRLLRGCLDFTAEIILWHHRFQKSDYPKVIPKPLHEYSRGTEIMIPVFGRILALADCYDALHRVNKKFESPPTGLEIKDKMITFNPDQRLLIEDLYEAGIFTTALTES